MCSAFLVGAVAFRAERNQIGERVGLGLPFQPEVPPRDAVMHIERLAQLLGRYPAALAHLIALAGRIARRFPIGAVGRIVTATPGGVARATMSATTPSQSALHRAEPPARTRPHHVGVAALFTGGLVSDEQSRADRATLRKPTAAQRAILTWPAQIIFKLGVALRALRAGFAPMSARVLRVASPRAGQSQVRGILQEHGATDHTGRIAGHTPRTTVCFAALSGATNAAFRAGCNVKDAVAMDACDIRHHPTPIYVESP